MSLTRVQVSIQGASGLPRDEYVSSVYHYSADEITEGNRENIANSCIAFFNAIKGYLSPMVAGASSGAVHTVKQYTVGALIDSPPVHTTAFTLVIPAATTPMPAEVALCLSYHADPQPGVVRQSWRGRVFIGPWSTIATGAASATEAGRPDSTFATAFLNAGKDWFDHLNATDTFPLGPPVSTGGKAQVYSRKLGRAFPVATVSVDDAWDTMRSRGLAPTIVNKLTLSEGGGGGHTVPTGPTH